MKTPQPTKAISSVPPMKPVNLAPIPVAGNVGKVGGKVGAKAGAKKKAATAKNNLSVKVKGTPSKVQDVLGGMKGRKP